MRLWSQKHKQKARCATKHSGFFYCFDSVLTRQAQPADVSCDIAKGGDQIA